MKMFVAATVLSLVAGSAFAGEGNGNPFPFTAAPLSVTTAGVVAPGLVTLSDRVLPSSGSNGIVQTANSLPRGFEDGVPGANLNLSAPEATQLAQPTVPQLLPRG